MAHAELPIRACRVTTLLALLAHTAALAATPRATPRSVVSATASTLEAPAASVTVPVSSSRGGALLDGFLASFRGHFDNHAQVVEDGAAGLLPRQGGGHEHIHCHVQPVDALACGGQRYALASYYFDNDPEKLFRERLYAVRELRADAQFGECIQMRILQLTAETTAALREGCGEVAAIEWSDADVDESLVLPGCDVFWRLTGDGRFEGEMRTESVELMSERMGMRIVVRDDVTLTCDGLWVNDRGSDTQGNYLYGNIHGVPYKMDRVQPAPRPCELPMDDFESWLSAC